MTSKRPYTKEDLLRLSLAVREHIIRMSTDGGCFIGASLSCADLLVHLYARVLRVSKEALDDPARDYLLLSKGHDVPALYGTLAEFGFIERSRLGALLETSDGLYWHPNRAVPGVEFHSGSLGHLLSVGIGVALDMRLRGGKNRVFVVVGDGELDEGSMWEAMLVASACKLDNLVVVVDRNQFQANARTEELLPLEPLDQKIAAFGFAVTSIDGHDFDALDSAFSSLPHARGKPTAVIAETVCGKGLPSIEARADRWLVNFTPAEVEMLLAELYLLVRHRRAARVLPLALDERWFKPALLSDVLAYEGFTGEQVADRVEKDLLRDEARDLGAGGRPTHLRTRPPRQAGGTDGM